MKTAIHVVGLAVLLLLVGCGQQAYEDTYVLTSADAPPTSSGWIIVDRSEEDGEVTMIKAVNVRIDHLLRRLAEQEGRELDFVATGTKIGMTVNLSDMTLSQAIEVIGNGFGFKLTEVNGRYVVTDEEGAADK